MQEDKSLFRYELAAVLIIKDEAIYIKEWLDYHLLVGVEHFFIYDNESSDDLRQVLRPYIERGVVTCHSIEGRCAQCAAYGDAIRRYRFECRYLVCIDVDEFINLRGNESIIDLVDEMFARDDQVAGFAMHMVNFGSNGLKAAEYDKGVLERFTRRAPIEHTHNRYIKTIVDPRRVKFYPGPHNANYFADGKAIDENGWVCPDAGHEPITANRIAVNHYGIKSVEEYKRRIARGDAFFFDNPRSMERFREFDLNDEFDDSILKSQQRLQKRNLNAENETQRDVRLLNALMQTVSSVSGNVPEEFYVGRLHEFLTLRAVLNRLGSRRLFDENEHALLENLLLKCVMRSLTAEGLKAWQIELLFDELPGISKQPYPVVKEIKRAYREVIIPQMLLDCRCQTNWGEYRYIDYIFRML